MSKLARLPALVALVFLLLPFAGCQKGNGLRPSSWKQGGEGGPPTPGAAAAAEPAPAPGTLLDRQVARVAERMSGEDLESLSRDWPRATELPGRADGYRRVALTDPAGAAPDAVRYAAMVDRGDPYVYWIEVSAPDGRILEYRGPSRLE